MQAAEPGSSELLLCQYPTWSSLFPSHALRSQILRLPDEFVQYLLSDGVFVGEASQAVRDTFGAWNPCRFRS